MTGDIIRGVELLHAGAGIGAETLSMDDLRTIAANYAAQGFRAPVKIAGEGDGATALGWIENLRLVGTALVGDIVQAPGRLMEMVRAGKVRRVRPEIWLRYERNSKLLGKVLKAVGLVGPSPLPAEAWLSSAVGAEMTFGSAVSFRYTSTEEMSTMSDDRPKTPSDAGAEVDRRVREFQMLHPDLSYERAFNMVLDADPRLKAMYSGYGDHLEAAGARRVGEPAQFSIPEEWRDPRRVRAELQARIDAYFDAHPGLNRQRDYETVFKTVLDADEVLKAAYVRA